MKVSAICNAGIYLEENGYGLLIDGIERGGGPFLPLADSLFLDMKCRSNLFSSLCALAFTHNHSDHFDRIMVKELSYLNRDDIFCPWELHAGLQKHFGPFTVEAKEISHLPFDGTISHNYSLFISAESGKTVFIAGDSVIDSDSFLDLISGRPITVAFINHMLLCNPKGKAFLAAAKPDRICLYHLSVDPQGGIMKRAKSLYDSNKECYPCLLFADSYPMTILSE